MKPKDKGKEKQKRKKPKNKKQEKNQPKSPGMTSTAGLFSLSLAELIKMSWRASGNAPSSPTCQTGDNGVTGGSNYNKETNESHQTNEEWFAMRNDRIGSDGLAGSKFLTQNSKNRDC